MVLIVYGGQRRVEVNVLEPRAVDMGCTLDPETIFPETDAVVLRIALVLYRNQEIHVLFADLAVMGGMS